MNPNDTLQWEMNLLLIDIKLSQVLVGCLLFATITKSNLKYGTRVVSRYSSAPKEIPMTTTKNILQHLKATNDYGIFYPKHYEGNMKSYIDAIYARDLDTRKLTLGISNKWKDAFVNWYSKRQLIVSFSTTKAKYKGMT